jgi:hypothetical protein
VIIATYILKGNTSGPNIKYRWRATFEFLISNYETSQLTKRYIAFAPRIFFNQFLKVFKKNNYYFFFKYPYAFLKLILLINFTDIYNVFFYVKVRDLQLRL